MPFSEADENNDTYLNIRELQTMVMSSEIVHDDWSCTEINYADMSSELNPSITLDKKVNGVEYQIPWEYNIKDGERYELVNGISCKKKDTNVYLNSCNVFKGLHSIENEINATETYEPIETVVNKQDIGSKNLVLDTHSKFRPHGRHCRSSRTLSNSHNLSSNHYINEGSFQNCKTIDPPQRHQGVYNLEKSNSFLDTIDRPSIGRRHSIQTEYKCRDKSLQIQASNNSDIKGENQVHQRINFRTSKSLKMASSTYLFGLSKSDEIYEGIEWNPSIYKSLSLSKPGTDLCRQSDNERMITPIEKTMLSDDLQRASTIPDFGRPLHDVYYAEVTLSGGGQLMDSDTSQYIDIIANYEDIKAAKTAIGSFSGVNIDKSVHGRLPMRRCKSEMARSANFQGFCFDFFTQW